MELEARRCLWSPLGLAMLAISWAAAVPFPWYVSCRVIQLPTKLWIQSGSETIAHGRFQDATLASAENGEWRNDLV